MGVWSLLAQGRRADLEKFRFDREDRITAQSWYPGRGTLRGKCGEKTRRRFRVHHAGIRRPRSLVAEGSQPAAQRRSQRFQTVRSGRALADGAGVRSGAERSQGLRVADPALERGRQPIFLTLEKRTLEITPRQFISHARRFPAGAAAADRLAAAYS